MHLIMNTLNTTVIIMKIEQYLENIKPYLGKMIDNLKTSGEQKLYLTRKSNFMSSEDSGESQLVIIDIMIDNNTNKNINGVFSSLLIRYRIGIETSRKGRDLSLIVLHYECHKIHLNRVGLYIDNPDCIKK